MRNYAIPPLQQRDFVDNIILYNEILKIRNSSCSTSISRMAQLSVVVLKQPGHQDHPILILLISGCDYLKNIAFSGSITNLDDLKTHIPQHIHNVAPTTYILLSAAEHAVSGFQLVAEMLSSILNIFSASLASIKKRFCCFSEVFALRKFKN